MTSTDQHKLVNLFLRGEVEPVLPDEILLLGCERLRGWVPYDGVELVADLGIRLHVPVGRATAQGSRQAMVLALHEVLQGDLWVRHQHQLSLGVECEPIISTL